MATIMPWVVLPYASIVVFVVGTIHRYRRSQHTGSSYLYRNVVLRWGNPLFHAGILLVLAGHAVGLLVPKSWTDAVGITDARYHDASVFTGTAAGALTVLGLAILVTRRLLVRPGLLATTDNDKVMYLFLTVAVLLGLAATLLDTGVGGYDYRESVSPWFRSLLTLRPHPELMTGVPLSLQLHVVAGFALIALWPFTRLLHALSLPIGFVHQYVVHRRRERARSAG